MTDTVFLLGAGFSKAAGVPLLGGFVDRMWELAIRGKADHPLSEDDKDLFASAMKIRQELDGYHGRAEFDDRNIEDLLSILSFNVIGGGAGDRNKLKTMSAAIARTIELTCSVRHPGIALPHASVVEDGPAIYRDFWNALFKAQVQGKQFPTIITFNYDLVLERSLLQVLVGTHFGVESQLPFKRVQVQYHYPALPPTPYDVRYTTYTIGGDFQRRSHGTALDLASNSHIYPIQSIELLKLHGSLNFPRKKGGNLSSSSPGDKLTRAISDPYLLPPVFNKSSGSTTSQMWRTAIERIRAAKNVIIVGYSLPATDIYMQYFLKAGVGPNRDLNRIVVFDPVLFSSSESSAAMKSRYASCFAPQLRNRINFTPPTYSVAIQPGTADAFVDVLSNDPDALLF